jgi:hypothetical protein
LWFRIASEHETKAGDFNLVPFSKQLGFSSWPGRADHSTVQSDPVSALEILNHKRLALVPDHSMPAMDPDYGKQDNDIVWPAWKVLIPGEISEPLPEMDRGTHGREGTGHPYAWRIEVVFQKRVAHYDQARHL